MKNIIKENWVKIGAVLIILLFGVAFLLFYFQTQQKQILESSIKCSQDGLKFFDNYKTKNADFVVQGQTISTGYKFNEPIYHFNQQLNTCLILISYESSTHESLGKAVYDISHNEVTDIYSNKILISTENSKEDTQFQKQETLLMNE